MEVLEDEYLCYAFKLIPEDDTIKNFEENKGLLDMLKQNIAFLDVHETKDAPVFIFSEERACKECMVKMLNLFNCRYIGECAVKKNII